MHAMLQLSALRKFLVPNFHPIPHIPKTTIVHSVFQETPTTKLIKFSSFNKYIKIGRWRGFYRWGSQGLFQSWIQWKCLELHVSDVSHKVNIIRAQTSVVYTDENKQLILWETPGLPDRALIQTIRSAFHVLWSKGCGAEAGADVSVFFIDTSQGGRHLK